MADVALTSIGLLSDILGIGSFLTGPTIFDATPVEGTGVSVKLGISNNETGLRGQVAGGYGYNDGNGYLGMGSACEDGTDAGALCTFTIAQDNPDVQAEFISISAYNDSICVAWVVTTNHDGTATSGWNGDIGSVCGQPWAHNFEQFGTIKEDNNVWRPRCAWFSASGDSGAVSASFKYDTQAYGASSQAAVDSEDVCASTRFSTETGAISAEPDQPPSSGKRAVANRGSQALVRPDWMLNTVISSMSHEHTAASLCNSPTSHSPDFVGSDGLYCDMETKTLYPICSSGMVGQFLILSVQDKTISKRANARGSIDTIHKSYTSVRQWDL